MVDGLVSREQRVRSSDGAARRGSVRQRHLQLEPRGPSSWRRSVASRRRPSIARRRNRAAERRAGLPEPALRDGPVDHQRFALPPRELPDEQHGEHGSDEAAEKPPSMPRRCGARVSRVTVKCGRSSSVSAAGRGGRRVGRCGGRLVVPGGAGVRLSLASVTAGAGVNAKRGSRGARSSSGTAKCAIPTGSAASRAVSASDGRCATKRGSRGSCPTGAADGSVSCGVCVCVWVRSDSAGCSTAAEGPARPGRARTVRACPTGERRRLRWTEGQAGSAARCARSARCAAATGRRRHRATVPTCPSLPACNRCRKVTRPALRQRTAEAGPDDAHHRHPARQPVRSGPARAAARARERATRMR